MEKIGRIHSPRLGLLENPRFFVQAFGGWKGRSEVPSLVAAYEVDLDMKNLGTWDGCVVFLGGKIQWLLKWFR